jgi:cellulose synthase/poly-beta-1,6-N-acetylglucosamine synthase-like glycosyltransferase
MGRSYRLSGWALVTATALTGLLAELNYRRVSAAPASDPIDAGKVTVVVPARDEEHRIPRLLQSLQCLDYVNNEVVVVDDASHDGTGRVARHLGATVVTVDTLPQGWTGKAHACWLGASRSTGEWLLFTDADTIHSPRSLSAAVSAAVASESGMVSFLCRQQCESLWERLVLPYAYALYFAGRLRINTSRRTAVANGQYILMRRAEYERIGGHRAIRASVIDDVALAQRAHACGVRVLLMRGEPWVAVRMYDGLASLSEGLSKNAVSFLAASPAFGVLTVAATLIFAGSVPGAVKAASFRQGMAAYAVPAIALLPWMRRFGVPVMYAWLHPLAAFMFQLIALDSLRRTAFRRGVQWKGRRY